MWRWQQAQVRRKAGRPVTGDWRLAVAARPRGLGAAAGDWRLVAAKAKRLAASRRRGRNTTARMHTQRRGCTHDGEGATRRQGGNTTARAQYDCDTQHTQRAAADKCLIISEIMIFPVRFCRQQSTLLLDCQHVICHRPYRANRAAAGRSQVLQGLPEIISGPAGKSSLSAICQPREILYFCNRYSINTTS